MNASLSGLPLVTGSTGDLAELAQESQVLQQDSAGQTGFGPVLQQAHAVIAAEFAALQPGAAEAEGLLRQVESLPQSGKLLPLLEQLLQAASAKGTESRQLMQRIADTVQQITSSSDPGPHANPDTDSVLNLESALTQLLKEVPAANVPMATGAPVTGGAPVESVEALPAVERTNRHLPMPPVARPPVLAEAGDNSPVTAKLQSEPGSHSPGKALEPFPLRPLEPLQTESRQLATANLLATLKRMTLGTKSVTAEYPQRPESVTAAATASTGQTSSLPTSPLPTLSVNTPFAQADWEQSLSERIQWMANRQIQGARIRLNPAQLGPLEVRLQVHNDQASIQFSSGHGVVREALEAALPRLREMFDASGVELVNVDVSGQSFAGGQRPGDENGAAAGGMPSIAGADEAESALDTPLSSVLESGRLDLFA